MTETQIRSMINYDNWHLKMVVEESSLPTYEAVLDEMASALLASQIENGENKGKWLLEAIFEKRPNLEQLDIALDIVASTLGSEVPCYSIGALPDKNWLKDSLISFPPVTIENFYIYGSHIKDEPPVDKISLQIDAATAFGSGEHPTTEGCMKAINYLKTKAFNPNKVLDMGSGSGILSLAAAKVFNKKVYAVDIDEESIRVTKVNAEINNVDNLIQAKQGHGYRSVFARNNGPYDLILSNILAKPLIQMAPSAYKHVSQGGYVVLSGLLIRQEEWVLNAYKKQGFVVEKIYHIEEWSAIIVRKP